VLYSQVFEKKYIPLSNLNSDDVERQVEIENFHLHYFVKGEASHYHMKQQKLSNLSLYQESHQFFFFNIIVRITTQNRIKKPYLWTVLDYHNQHEYDHTLSIHNI
jgi:hypothetical protein